MLGHRTLNLDDYIAILKRRGWMILFPVVLLPLLALAITFFIPAQYLSQTLVLIEEQKVPDQYVKPVISEDLDSRLASMREQILSRSRIQPIIERYSLYSNTRMSMDDRIDLVRKSIGIKPIRSEIARSGGLPGFFISFTSNDAHTAQLVCGEITALFTSENLRSRQEAAQGTTDFLKGQLADAKRSLDEQDAKLAAFQRKYIGKLPGEGASNLNMLTSLNTQLEAANQALARMEQDKSYGDTLLTQQLQTSQPVPSTIPGVPASAAPPTPSALQTAELQTLEAQEADLTSHYTDSYPDVISVRRKIAELRKQMEKAPAPSPSSSGTRAAAIPRESAAVQQLRAQLKAAQLGVDSKRHEQEQLQNAIRTYQDRIQSSPLVEEEYKELTRDYTTAQTFYDGLLTNVNSSKMATDLEKRQQGEQFKIMDEPNLPDSPTFPNRLIFAGGGFAGGLFLGLALVAFLEYKDTSLRTERDVWAFTKLPTLAVIAWSGDLDHSRKPGLFARLKRSPKPPKEKKTKKSKEALVHAGS